MMYLILSIVFTTSLVLIFKTFERYNVNIFQAIVFNYITAALICFMTIKEPIKLYQISSEDWFPFSIIIGFLFITLFNLIAFSVQNIGISVTSVATKISLCIPVLFAFIYYNDELNFLKVFGIILALLAVYFTSQNNEKKKSIRSFLYFVPIILFIGSGVLDIIFIHSIETYDLVNQGIVLKFSSILYSIAAIIGLPILIINHFSGIKLELKNIIAGILLGIPNVLSIVFFLKCLNHYPESTFVFPINNIGIISLSAISAKILFNEYLSKINWLGILIAAVSILLLSIS